MPSYKDKAKRTSHANGIFSDVNHRFDEMEARSLVDGAILREIRNRVQQLSIAADASADVEKLAHLANQLKINFGEIESLAGVSSSVTLPPGEYTAEAVLNNLNQRMSDLLSHLKTSRLSSDAIIREIMGYPVTSHVAEGKIRVGADKHHTAHVPKEVFPEHRDVTGEPTKSEHRPNPLATHPGRTGTPPPRKEVPGHSARHEHRPTPSLPHSLKVGTTPTHHDPPRPGSAGTGAGASPSAGHKPNQSTGNIQTEQKGSGFANLFSGPQKKTDATPRR